ncbi:hypothetical protein [Fulvivirga sp.]|uniref:hypothetical protein n=1 Tax=Fulvivirga sp. TaxID=1931237 RepID=UPI0032EB106B
MASIIFTIGIISLIVFWLLFSPITVRLDTVNNIYYLKLLGILTIFPSWTSGEFKISIQFPFYRFELDPTDSRKWKKNEKVPSKKIKRNIPISKIISVIRSFKVKKFRINIDTDDYYWNALLTPLMLLFTHMGLQVSINFQGKNDCQLIITNSLWRMGWAYLR